MRLLSLSEASTQPRTGPAKVDQPTFPKKQVNSNVHTECAGSRARRAGARAPAARGRRRRPPAYVGANSTIQLSNFEGLVLGCIEAKFCK